MKKFFSIIVIITLILSFHTFFRDKNTIVIYHCLEDHRIEELQKQLNNKFPDINVSLIYSSTSKTAAKLQVEKTRTDADIVLALESSYMHGILDTLKNPKKYSHLNYLDGLKIEDNENKYVIWERTSASLIVDKKYFSENNLEYPKTYDDLLNPIYKNKIAMPDPKMSSTGYAIYKSLVNEWGIDKTLEYFDDLTPNIKQYTESGSGPTKLLMQGEICIALGLTYNGVEMINRGFDVEIITPEYGAPSTFSATGLINKNNEIADEIFEYIINDFMKYDKTYFSPEPVYEGQMNKIENYPSNIKYANMEGINDLNIKGELLSLWKY